MKIQSKIILAVLLITGSASLFAQASSCCGTQREAGQKAFEAKQWNLAIEAWSKGLACADAARCPDLGDLLAKAKREAANAEQTIDDNLYAIAESADVLAAYEVYLRKCVACKHKAKAEAAIKRLTGADPTPLSASPVLPEPIRNLEADMVRISGGVFTMGCQDPKREGYCYGAEKPARQVNVKEFSMGRYEVTQAQWRAVMGGDPPRLHNRGCDLCPVEGVSWNDVQEFLAKLNALTGRTYRLPSESEWEYAARGGSLSQGYRHSGSNTLDEVAWYARNYKQGNTHGAEKTTRPVGQKKANELGLYDMIGNVCEWTEDDWHANYLGAPTDSRAWIDQPRIPYRVYRGGSWIGELHDCRIITRNIGTPQDRFYRLGFRVALSPN